MSLHLKHHRRHAATRIRAMRRKHNPFLEHINEFIMCLLIILLLDIIFSYYLTPQLGEFSDFMTQMGH